MEPSASSAQDFAALGLSQPILHALDRIQISVPSPIQARAIPIARTGQDVMGIAETGTGKTFAFSLPIIERLLANQKAGKAIIVVPTRELALQVEENIRKLTRVLQSTLRTACLIGGAPMYRQVQDLRAHPRIIIATPGRMWDHMQQKNLNLSDVSVVVLDEADRMLDMGFSPQIKRILEETPASRQTMCFSATMAPEIAALAAAYMHDFATVEVERTHAAKKKIEQELAYLQSDSKNDVLHQVLSDHEGKVLVFTRTKFGAKRLAEKLRTLGHSSAEIHSNRSLGQRRQALDGFKAGKHRVLVATDVAARGIDVHDIALVVNFDLPDVAEDYVHRIGRTGRADRTGKAIAFATPDQVRDIRTIERVLGSGLPISAYSQVEIAERPQHQRFQGQRPGRSFGNQPRRQNFAGRLQGGQRSDRPEYGQRQERPQRPSYDNRPVIGEPNPFARRDNRDSREGQNQTNRRFDRNARPQRPTQQRSQSVQGPAVPAEGGYFMSRPSGQRSRMQQRSRARR